MNKKIIPKFDKHSIKSKSYIDNIGYRIDKNYFMILAK
uniref:Uncharacterized protein n=1 Tax=Laurencia snackeyi TaxID=1858662 RepID=A0A0G4KBV2_9FLOR|nr:Hypothetical protein orf37 [Laurencia snackeyi]